MKKIESFCVDHDKLMPGMYISRVDDDIVTYDIRMCIPNSGDYLDIKAAHTFEHIFATFVRNTDFSKNIIYVGPMGCLTGFYLIVRNLNNSDAISLVQNTFDFVSNFSGEIPGNTKKECGNFMAHDLAGAKELSNKMRLILNDWTEGQLIYKN